MVMQPVLRMTGVKVRRQGRTVLDIDHFAVAPGELVAIIGPNGAGKSSLLQVLNLLLPYCGKLELFGQNAATAQPLTVRRRCAMVFQETLLLDGTVFENVALGLKFRRLPREVVNDKVAAALDVFHCRHLADRQAARLSGGEAQRVCLARALVTDPELLLLDEPFAALDPSTRTALLTELRQLAQARSMTVLLVSHNFADVLYFADRAVAMAHGRIIQDDYPEALLRHPANEIVARLVGMDNIFACTVEPGSEQTVVRLTESIWFTLPGRHEAVRCCLPADAIYLWDERLSFARPPWVVVDGIVRQVVPGIGAERIMVQAEGIVFTLLAPRRQDTNRLQAGVPVRLAFHPADVHLL
ncbi:tungstate transport system ATP-binding protein [Sporolituus thermophilus DSM 23256]|uniref:Tungstate transport system ATP-binding protein n=2 Tax=Sporolituus TaxID=909931 RepID=A0A1G7MBD9_9FIRM|nr:tungstate transport system ATP-binding protein [Sporolituus thermophilus DSM 23256]